MRLEDEIHWIALTVLQEAANQSFSGKLAVAFVIVNRAKKNKISCIDTVLQSYQFSCWNSDSPTKKMIANAENNSAWFECHQAASAAFYDLLKDPSNGATHYLNPRRVPKFPAWYSKEKIVAVIDDHEFLKL